MTTNPALAGLQFLAGAWDMEKSLDGGATCEHDFTVHYRRGLRSEPGLEGCQSWTVSALSRCDVTAEECAGCPSSRTLAKLAEQSVHRLGDLPGLGQ